MNDLEGWVAMLKTPAQVNVDTDCDGMADDVPVMGSLVKTYIAARTACGGDSSPWDSAIDVWLNAAVPTDGRVALFEGVTTAGNPFITIKAQDDGDDGNLGNGNGTILFNHAISGD
jgi:hypothetical protein